MGFIPGSILKVKKVNATGYQNQMDSAADEGWRKCYSSSSAMFCEALRPGVLKNHPLRRPGEQLDDFYYRMLVQETGLDTTNTDAQMRMHRYFGINSKFSQQGSRQTLEYYLSIGLWVMTGQLHHWRYERPDPTRSHWSLCCGWTPENDAFVFHDPAGEMNVIDGGYIGSEGKYRKYAWDKWKRRWMADQAGNFVDGSGWCIVPIVNKATGKYVPLVA